MELTDQEWLREFARTFEEAHRCPGGIIRVSDELARQMADRMREIADEHRQPERSASD